MNRRSFLGSILAIACAPTPTLLEDAARARLITAFDWARHERPSVFYQWFRRTAQGYVLVAESDTNAMAMFQSSPGVWEPR